MANPILVTGAAGRVGGVGRTVTELLLKEGKVVRAMVRNEDERAQALRDMGAEVVAGDLLDLDSMHRVIAGCETMYFGMSVCKLSPCVASFEGATVSRTSNEKHWPSHSSELRSPAKLLLSHHPTGTLRRNRPSNQRSSG